MLFFGEGSETRSFTAEDLKSAISTAMERFRGVRKVLAIPPDATRAHSRAGEITGYLHGLFGNALTDVMPALGTHFPMTDDEIATMFPGVPRNLFRQHDWRRDVRSIGTVPGEFIRDVSEGKLDYDWPAQVNKLLVEGEFDLILSIGQVVPHEVIGMANHNKNIFIGVGGAEGINKSHFLGAVYGMERIMGRADTPVRRVLNYASENFAANLPIVYIQTVVSRQPDGRLATRGVFVGDDEECFLKAAELSLKVNFESLDRPLEKVVVYLDPEEFKSTWLGNKAIYRTRMAIADGGELVVLAPGVNSFGEDSDIDALIRKYGYRSTPEVLDAVEKNDDLRNNLSAAAHLIHGSSEGRFKITYCPGGLSKREIESVGYNFADLDKMVARYTPDALADGFNSTPDGEEMFFISNPALGLWTAPRH